MKPWEERPIDTTAGITDLNSRIGALQRKRDIKKSVAARMTDPDREKTRDTQGYQDSWAFS